MAIEGLGISVMCVTWIFTTISIAVVLGRIYTRSRVLKRITIDDYLAVFTLLLSLGNAILLSISCYYGLGQSITSLADPARISNTVKYVYLCEFFSIMCPCFGRISFALMLLSLTPPTVTRRGLLWTVIITAFVIDLGTLIISFSQCRPIAAFWDGRDNPDCWPKQVQRDAGFFQGSYGSAVDLTLAAFPASLFWNLQMSLKQRISLSAMMGFGVFAMAASIFKTVELQAITSTENVTYEMAKLAIGWTLEANFVLIAASIPTLRPILKSKKQRESHSSYSQRSAKIRRNIQFPFEELDDDALHGATVETKGDSDNSAYQLSNVSHSDEVPFQDADRIRRDITVAVSYERS
ncbi:integral membrane protein [Cordyceps fumosorosea ARSEF 2679]|uniref:Integral membrane protein n=1 Tax=Cordyceps fumosorosea (strain ARSEF 2679) TaxID=1081104 RepID=A0A167LBY7_CORFA|nr:integral membrane protein [Cordyceps fumosorosea ARSEF 2679]OAA52904.1 integral membrane protein [Cordyceps fumosorosea ARSEF 2679]